MADLKQKYIKTKEMKNKYPKGDYKVNGEFILNKPVDEDKGYLVETVNGDSIRVRSNGYYKRSKYKIVAYIQIGDDEYIAVLKRNWLPILIPLLLALILLVGGYFIWKSNQGPDIDPSIKDYVTQLKRPENLDKSQIAVPGITEIVMDANTDVIRGEILINPEGNPCYFKYTLVMDNTNEVLYESKLVPPGKGISEVKLKKKMARGTYKVTLKINTFDLEDYDSPLNGAEIKSVLRVLE